MFGLWIGFDDREDLSNLDANDLNYALDQKTPAADPTGEFDFGQVFCQSCCRFAWCGMTDAPIENPVLPLIGLPVRVIKSYPLITVSKTYGTRPFGIAPLLAEHVPERQSLNFIQLAWSNENPEKVTQLAADLRQARSNTPGAQFVVFANTEFESYLMSERGIPNTLASQVIFADDLIYRPQPNIEKVFDAVYNARLVPMKRHELSESVDRRLVMYLPEQEADRAYAQNLRTKQSSALFLNHHLGGGQYRMLSAAEVSHYLNSAHVGLCLSATEGVMRASTEYLLAGLAVVSTSCYGGRERYYHPDYCRIVEPELEAVELAVRELAAADLDPFFIRRRTLSIINRERTNFIRFANSMARHHFNIRNLFPDFEAFRGDVAYADVKSISERLKGKPGSSHG